VSGCQVVGWFRLMEIRILDDWVFKTFKIFKFTGNEFNYRI